MPRQPYHARATRPDHLDFHAVAKSELLEPVNLGRIPQNLPDFGDLSRRETTQRNQIVHGRHPRHDGSLLKVRLYLTIDKRIISRLASLGNG